MSKVKSSAFFALLFVAAFGMQVSCVDHDFPSYTCPDAKVSFLADIKPILEAKCAIPSCHNGSLGEERNWTNFETFQENAQHGHVKNYVTNRIMPPSFSTNGGLSQDQINAIACWIDDNAPNN